jgi:hypothetical protein
VTLLTVTACITAVQRIVYVHRVTQAIDHPELHPAGASVPPAVATGGRDPGLPS